MDMDAITDQLFEWFMATVLGIARFAGWICELFQEEK
jgi:hypothetical protein